MDENLKKAIATSGNNLHLKAVQIIKETVKKGSLAWDIKISSYYCDEITDKPREIDIIATMGVYAQGFDIHLFIECKHFTEQVAFRTFPVDTKEIKKTILTKGVDEKELDWNSIFSRRRHHFLTSDKIGKLYDTKSQKDIFDAITQPIKSFIFFERTFSRPFIAYLIVVFEGIDGIYQIEGNDISKPDSWPCDKRALMSANYSYKDLIKLIFHRPNFTIDFIHIDELKNFIEETVIPEATVIRDELERIKKIKEEEGKKI